MTANTRLINALRAVPVVRVSFLERFAKGKVAGSGYVRRQRSARSDGSLVSTRHARQLNFLRYDEDRAKKTPGATTTLRLVVLNIRSNIIKHRFALLSC